uniref:Actin n=1 Tax=Arcella intermedia TaxID=1963864 RepID=A0A6B2LQ87_9EUKA
MPDGQVVSVGSERFECPEALFRPWLVGSRSLGLSECAVRSIVGSEGSLQRDLFGSVVLSGGSTMFLGLAERLQQEMEKMAPPGVVVKVLAPPEREYSAWIGGSILACLQNFTSWTITKQQYLETGPLIVHRKCF